MHEEGLEVEAHAQVDLDAVGALLEGDADALQAVFGRVGWRCAVGDDQGRLHRVILEASRVEGTDVDSDYACYFRGDEF